MFMGKSAIRSKALFGVTAIFFVAAMLQAASASADDTVYYYYTDSLHSAVAETDAQGNVVERTYYAPYGQVLNRDLRDGPGYTGHEEDPETGLVYMQQRYYCPECGRFLSVDPVGVDPTNAGNFNRYEYAKDNPYRYTDPFGLYICSGNKTQCADVQSAIQGVNRAAANLKAGSADQNRLNAVVKFFGAEGKANGVTVKFGSADGNEAETHTEGKNVTITFNLKKMSQDFSNRSDGSTEKSEIAGSVAHEGTHGINGRDSGGDPRDPIQELSTELNAFSAQAAVAKGLGVNSAYGLWNTGWSATQADSKSGQAVISNADRTAELWCSAYCQ